MFARSYSFILSVIFFMATLVAASPAPWGGAAPTKTITVTATPAPTGNPYQCHTGPIQCCKQVQKVGLLTDDRSKN